MLLWSIARASAFVAFGAYTVVVAWGIMLAGRAFRPAAPQVHFHRFLGMVGLTAVVTHISALLLDHYSKVHPLMVLGIGAKPSMLAGVIALWLSVALPLSFRLRRSKWISQKVWRSFHYVGYLMWAVMLAHGIFNGTDTASPFALATYTASAAVVVGCAVWRWSSPAPKTTPAPRRTPAAPVRRG